MAMKKTSIVYVSILLYSLFTFGESSPKRNPNCSNSNSNAENPLPMEYIEICKIKDDCRKFSRLVMGTDHLVQGNWSGDGKPEINQEKAFAVFDEAAKNGINFFDTSPIYVGGVENKLGAWRESRKSLIQQDNFYANSALNPDRKLYVLSKGGFPFDLFYSKNLPLGEHSKELKQALDKQKILNSKDISNTQETPLNNVPPGTYASRLFGSQELISSRVKEEMSHTLKNLQGDITIYLMHRDDGDSINFKRIQRPQTPVKTIMKALADERVSQGFWMLGWSNWTPLRLNESLSLARKEKDLLKPIINSPYFSLFEMSDRTIHALGVQVKHKDMMNPNFEKGIKIMPYSPLGGFSILDKPEPIWENAEKSAREKFESGDAYWKNVYPSIFTPENKARWKRVVQWTQTFNEKNCTQYTVDQMMNAYVLAHPRVDFLAVGPVTVEQLHRTLESVKLSKLLTAKDLDYLYQGH